MKVYVTTNTDGKIIGWATSSGDINEIEIDLEDNHPFFTDNPFLYVYQDGTLVRSDSIMLEKMKVSKNAELKQACETAILAGFTSANGHVYRTNRDDQTNMIGQKDKLMSDSTISTVQWKTEDVGYVSHTRDEWFTVYNEAFEHKQQQLFKYDSLKGQVNACTTPEAVQVILW